MQEIYKSKWKIHTAAYSYSDMSSTVFRGLWRGRGEGGVGYPEGEAKGGRGRGYPN